MASLYTCVMAWDGGKGVDWKVKVGCCLATSRATMRKLRLGSYYMAVTPECFDLQQGRSGRHRGGGTK